MTAYATLAQVRSEIKTADLDISADPYVRLTILQMSERLEYLTEKQFMPRIAAYTFDTRGDHLDMDGRSLYVWDKPLLVLGRVGLADRLPATVTSSRALTAELRTAEPVATVRSRANETSSAARCACSSPIKGLTNAATASTSTRTP